TVPTLASAIPLILLCQCFHKNSRRSVRPFVSRKCSRLYRPPSHSQQNPPAISYGDRFVVVLTGCFWRFFASQLEGPTSSSTVTLTVSYASLCLDTAKV